MAAVTDVADAACGRSLGGSGGLSRLWPQPAGRSLTCGTGQGLHRCLDVVPLLLLRHAAGDHAVDGDAVPDNLVTTAQAMAHQERIVFGGKRIHGNGGLDGDCSGDSEIGIARARGSFYTTGSD